MVNGALDLSPIRVEASFDSALIGVDERSSHEPARLVTADFRTLAAVLEVACFLCFLHIAFMPLDRVSAIDQKQL